MSRGTRRLSVKNSDIPNQHHQTAHYAPLMMPYKKTNRPVGQMRRGTRRLSVKNSDIPNQRPKTAHYTSFMMPYEKPTS